MRIETQSAETVSPAPMNRTVLAIVSLINICGKNEWMSERQGGKEWGREVCIPLEFATISCLCVTAVVGLTVAKASSDLGPRGNRVSGVAVVAAAMLGWWSGQDVYEGVWGGCLYTSFSFSKSELHRNLIFRTEKSGNGYWRCERNPCLVKGVRQRLPSLFPKQPRKGSGDSSPSISYVPGCFRHWLFIELSRCASAI